MTQTATRTLPDIGDWSSPSELLRLQEARIPEVLQWAARSPFYSRRWAEGPAPRTTADFAALPMTSKQDLRDNYPFGMLGVDKARLATYHESSGTAGQPTPSYYTAEDWIDLSDRYARKWIPITRSDVFLVRTPYALMITGHLAQAAARSQGATVVPGDNRSLAMPYSRVVRVLHDLGVSLTWSMPTETLMWAAAAEAAGYRPDKDFPALRALFVGGEPLSQARRQLIRRVWGVPVVEEYGSTETGSLAGECPEGRLHLWSDRVLFEVYDPSTGRLSREGSGQLVATPLYREAMPLLRYNIEDHVEVSGEECPCGWLLPTVKVYGRAAFGYPVGLGEVTQSSLEDLVFQLPIEHGVKFWRAKAEHHRLVVQLEVVPEHGDAACRFVADTVQRELHVPCSVQSVPPGTLVPLSTLTGVHDVVKPRSLFGPDEDWDKSLLYY
ncbi:phenylacetate--CoA ligase family protein [Actinacidiphila paucisporea]|uniref:Phenylacetate-CoA ligase n=1 Tax=Actinacidiphila paucisporea TaxID=310782 RepID=A0A1M7Q8B3_9ACTN|nr:AMP-binding protein [Actinacidiphila paucisporea]SHN26574.1 phenylacetate-CoA ligase [Actinacidiphila paucisporea]